MTSAAAGAPGFVGWVEAYGSIIGFFIQILFYIVVAGASAWAAVTFAKYVKFMTSDEDVATPVAADKSVEEFVE
jgi:hypothetical protein